MICRMAEIKDYALKITLTIPASFILEGCGDEEAVEYFEEAMKKGDTEEIHLLLVETISGDCLIGAMCLEGGSDWDSSLICNGIPNTVAKTPFY